MLTAPASPVRERAQRTDCDRLYVDDTEVWWISLVRHTSIRVTTTSMSIRTLLTDIPKVAKAN